MVLDLAKCKITAPGYRRLWKYFRDRDCSLIVYLTDTIPTTSSFEAVHDSGRAVGLRRQGEYWLKYKPVYKAWSKAGQTDREVLDGLEVIGTIPD